MLQMNENNDKLPIRAIDRRPWQSWALVQDNGTVIYEIEDSIDWEVAQEVTYFILGMLDNWRKDFV